MNYYLEKCNNSTYEVFQNIVSRSFGYSTKWFEKNYGHIFISSKDKKEYSISISNNYILKKDGLELGAIGIYPINIISDGVLYKVAGVGCVSVLPEHRKKGVMTEMMNKVQEIIKNENYDFSWLTGERIRYKRWGYDLAGKMLKISLDAKSFKLDEFNLDVTKITKGKVDDITDMKRMYSIYSNRVIRDETTWIKHIIRENLNWEYIPDKAYIVVDKKRENQILECSGEIGYVKLLIYNYFLQNRLDEIIIYLPCEVNEISNYFLKVCQDYKVQECGLWKKINKKIIKEIDYSSGIINSCNNIIHGYISMVDFV